MSRLWYAGLLNWARYLINYGEIIIDFVYTLGVYSEKRNRMVISSVLAIPGFEDNTSRPEGVTVFGLGFDHFTTLCVLDQLEPDKVYTYLASPGVHDKYVNKVLKSNKEIIEKHSFQTLKIPIQSIERTFTCLSELISPHLSKSNITLVPMGPKPHVLANILLAIRFGEITCLRVNAERSIPTPVKASGDIIATQVHFKKIDQRGK